MNWRRGLVRTWLALSIIWLIVAAIYFSVPESLENLLIEWPEAVRYAKATNPDPTSPFEWPPNVSDIEAHNTAIENLWLFVYFGFGSPAVVLILVIVARWVAQGFRPRPH
jgi:hypothetical protein